MSGYTKAEAHAKLLEWIEAHPVDEWTISAGESGGLYSGSAHDKKGVMHSCCIEYEQNE